jgi:hypothetical protein
MKPVTDTIVSLLEGVLDETACEFWRGCDEAATWIVWHKVKCKHVGPFLMCSEHAQNSLDLGKMARMGESVNGTCPHCGRCLVEGRRTRLEDAKAEKL